MAHNEDKMKENHIQWFDHVQIKLKSAAVANVNGLNFATLK